MATIVVLIPDLMFGTRVADVAHTLGHTTREVRDAAELLSAARNDAAAIVLDTNSQTDWPTVIQALKADRRTQQIPVLAFGSHVNVEAQRAAVTSGCDHVVTRGKFAQRMPDLIRQITIAAMPAERIEPQLEPRAAEPIPAIMLVEDTPYLLVVLRRILRDLQLGYDIIAFDNGENALAQAEQHRCVLLITDYALNGTNGLDLAAEFKRRYGSKVVLMTAYSTRELREAASSMGIDLFLPKPFKVQELEAAVGRLLPTRPVEAGIATVIKRPAESPR